MVSAWLIVASKALALCVSASYAAAFDLPQLPEFTLNITISTRAVRELETIPYYELRMRKGFKLMNNNTVTYNAPFATTPGTELIANKGVTFHWDDSFIASVTTNRAIASRIFHKGQRVYYSQAVGWTGPYRFTPKNYVAVSKRYGATDPVTLLWHRVSTHGSEWCPMYVEAEPSSADIVGAPVPTVELSFGTGGISGPWTTVDVSRTHRVCIDKPNDVVDGLYFYLNRTVC